MGGFGAAQLGLRHQDLFAAIIIWDGAMHDWRTITAGRSKIASKQFGGDEQFFQLWSPWAIAEQADLERTRILIVAGLMEDYNERFHRHVAALGAKATFASIDCLHDLRCLVGTYGSGPPISYAIGVTRNTSLSPSDIASHTPAPPPPPSPWQASLPARWVTC